MECIGRFYFWGSFPRTAECMKALNLGAIHWHFDRHPAAVTERSKEIGAQRPLCDKVMQAVDSECQFARLREQREVNATVRFFALFFRPGGHVNVFQGSLFPHLF
jgi:hypothetical protein